VQRIAPAPVVKTIPRSVRPSEGMTSFGRQPSTHNSSPAGVNSRWHCTTGTAISTV